VKRRLLQPSVLLLGLVGLAVGCTQAGAPPTSPAPTAIASPSPSSSAPDSAPPSSAPPTQAATPAESPSASPAPSAGCVDPPPDLATIVALDAPARLACFGGSSLSFDATISKPILDCGIGPRVEPAWFCLPGVFLAVPDASPDTGLQSLDAYWDPASGLTPTSFTAGRTMRITGHFDDPAASTCHVASVPKGQSPEPPGAVVLGCREAFIVTAAH